MSKKVYNKCIFDMYNFDNKHVLLIGRGRAHIMDDEFSVVYTSPHMPNLSGACWNKNRNSCILYNTTGRAWLISVEDGNIICKFSLEVFSENPIATLEDNFLFVDKKGKVQLMDSQSGKTSEIHFKGIAPNPSKKITNIINYENKFIITWRLRVEHNSKKEEITESVMICRHSENVLIPEEETIVPGEFIHHPRLIDSQGNMCYIADFWELNIYNCRLCSFKVQSKKSKTVISLDLQKDKDLSSVDKYAYNHELKLFALVSSDFVWLYSLNERKIIYEEKFLYGSDCLWLDKNRLLVSTWKGLYLISVNENTENDTIS